VKAKTTKSASKKAVPAKKASKAIAATKPVAKKAVKKPVPSKKSAAKKASPVKAVAKKVAAKKVVAKKVVAKKAPVKKVVASKVVSKKPVAKKPTNTNQLANNKVKYIMIGGFAAILHGGSRITQDVDIWIKDTAENRKKFRTAIANIGLGDYPELETTEFIPGWTSIYLYQGFDQGALRERSHQHQYIDSPCLFCSAK
jgi:hypothetical protein